MRSIPSASDAASGAIMRDLRGTPYAFETIIWIEAVDETLWMEWIPLCEEGLASGKGVVADGNGVYKRAR